MKQTIRYMALAAVATLLFSACSDDFLAEKRNYDNVNADIYDYVEGCEGRLNDIYAWCLPIVGDVTGTINRNFPISMGNADLCSKSTEEYTGFSDFVNPEIELTSMSGTNGVPDFFTAQTQNIQASVYGRIRNINDCIAGIEGSSLPAEQKEPLLGQVYFFRAWAYFNLFRWYGGVPLVTEVLEPEEGNFTPRSSARATMQFILADLDRAAIDAYRRKALERGRHTEEDVSVSDGQVISDLKLLDETPSGAGDLMRAAVLMFHPEPERIVTGATVKVAYYAPEGAYGQNRADDIIFQDEVTGPLILQADKVVDLVYTKYLKALTSYEGLQRIETFLTPRAAFREVILNAINHKLYESGNPIQISVYDDKVVVFNQGHWPEDIGLEDVYTKKHSSYPHNPNLSKVFFNSGEIEAYGSGFARIRLECDRKDAPYPELTVTPNGVTVVMRACEQYMRLLRYGRYWETYPEFKRRDAASLVDADGEWLTDEDGAPTVVEETRYLDAATLASIDRMAETLAESLSDREKSAIDPIFQYLKTHEVIDNGIARQLTGKSSTTINRYIGRLVELGVLAPEGRSRGTVYRRL